MSTKVLIAAIIVFTGVLVAPASQAQNDQTQNDQTCDKGEFCVWTAAQYQGQAKRLDLETANPSECIPLGLEGRSFANRLSRDVSVYQSETCSTEAEFTTYPKNGTYVPDAYFVIRAITVWEP
ncbi:hypothetical protein Lesp02_46210 [Lentzea sp. NBRC 105346]|uniref:peptidase inhibitor family I36 protein n=1 Tax=Lentzea sp. NBRC 105346 TaxID=3032205 RepID=UPI0024A15F46|nr:peptidase inhibitor family I36 protein [Lentzea sp. NBRC 105346]GLZ32433.1 hypothetical protein Lesp02_46210 [Lentzea sp. NBRC 105346]